MRSKNLTFLCILGSALALREALLAASARDALVAARLGREPAAKALAAELRARRADALSDAERGVVARACLGTAALARRYAHVGRATLPRFDAACERDAAAAMLALHAEDAFSRGAPSAARRADTLAPACFRRLVDDAALRAALAAPRRDRAPNATAVWPSPGSTEHLVAFHGAPRWLAWRWRRDHGDELAARIAAASTGAPGPVSLRANARAAASQPAGADTPADALVAALAAVGVAASRPAPRVGAPHAVTLRDGRPRGGAWALPGWADAAFEVQDAGSQAIAAACGPLAPGEAALDLCAGNGGKALALGCANAERGGVAVWCHDVAPDRLARALARADKAGLLADGTIRSSGGALGALPRGRAFSCVLVDAPCSGSGVVRRGRALAVGADDEAEAAAALEAFAALQLALLREGAARSADRLVYATCSTLREENEDVVAAFDDPDFAPWPFDGAALSGCRGHARALLPGDAHDGFFIARWRRIGS